MVVEPLDRRGVTARRGRRPCPPHGPHLVDVVVGGSYVAHYLQCRLVPRARVDPSTAFHLLERMSFC
jgi:hypothetical protein